VEDEPDVRMLASEALEEAGFRLLEAQQRGEALALAKKHRGAIHRLLPTWSCRRWAGRSWPIGWPPPTRK
jgi:CheY-like chemotaxis protein